MQGLLTLERAGRAAVGPADATACRGRAPGVRPAAGARSGIIGVALETLAAGEWDQVMTSEFGALPYRACLYGPPANKLTVELAPADNDIAALRSLLEQLKRGQFTAVASLGRFLLHPSIDVRQYARQLFAHVCSHVAVAALGDTFRSISDFDEFHRTILRVGETLSTNAFEVLQNLNEEFGDDDDSAESILLALRILIDPDAIDRLTPNKEEIRELIAKERRKCAKPEYCYRGQPVFVGNVTKELVTSAMVANREKRPIMLFRQFQILSTFTGTPCPVEHGQAVSDKDVMAVFDYVKTVAKFPWRPGVKYFYGFEMK
jgi:hypothetical protein